MDADVLFNFLLKYFLEYPFCRSRRRKDSGKKLENSFIREWRYALRRRRLQHAKLRVMSVSTKFAVKKCWVVKESVKEGRSGERNTTIINNFDFHLKIRRIPKTESLLRLRGEVSSIWLSGKCVINENKIIDKKRSRRKTFHSVEKLHSLVERDKRMESEKKISDY